MSSNLAVCFNSGCLIKFNKKLDISHYYKEDDVIISVIFVDVLIIKCLLVFCLFDD